MKISYNWIKQFIAIKWPVEQAAALLTDLGLEVEGVNKFESVLGGLEGVVVGEVLECTSHPNADRLRICKVSVGDGSPLSIVCGAPNVSQGQKVPVALVGTTLYDAEGKPWTLKKGKIRGEVSEGMICAEDELHLGKDHSGIMVLNPESKVGTPLAKLFGVEIDEVLEISLTPNRADAMSHMGVARDLRAGLAQKGINLSLNTPSVSSFKVENHLLRIDVDIKDKQRCLRYCGVTISGVKVKESPVWLQNRLKTIGLTPKNNIVDVTNYVMHELGQPLHAFDAAKVHGGKIIVKTLTENTPFITLDGIERKLHSEDLMICDTEKPLCIAGVFGGINSGITEHTTHIFLESAYFSPSTVRRTAKRHGLNTDASFRFERGVDINMTYNALLRAAILIQELSGGLVSMEVTDNFPTKIPDFQVFLSFDKIDKLIGQEIPRETIKSILSSLEIKVNNISESGIGITIPSYRVDVKREVDVIEEIARIYGYNRIEFGTKIHASIAERSLVEDLRLRDIISDQLVAQGFHEIMTNSLVSVDKNDPGQVHLLNPLSQDLGALRGSMISSGLQVLTYNFNRKHKSQSLFEFGSTYAINEGSFEERKHISLLMIGNRYEDNWRAPKAENDFYMLKGIVESILYRLGFKEFSYNTYKSAEIIEGLSLWINGKSIGFIGVLNPDFIWTYDLEASVTYGDLRWDALLNLIEVGKKQYQEISRYPEVTRDLALLLDESVTFESIRQEAFKAEQKLLLNLTLFDVYEGDKLPKGKKSYAIRLTLLDKNKTLTDHQIDNCVDRLTKHLAERVGAELR